jgi:hypothetical protein
MAMMAEVKLYLMEPVMFMLHLLPGQIIFLQPLDHFNPTRVAATRMGFY